MTTPTVSRFSYSPRLARINRWLMPLKERPGIGCVTPLDIARTACKAAGAPVVNDLAEMNSLLGPEFATAVDLSTRWRLSAMGQIQWRAVLTTAALVRLQLDAHLAAGRPVAELEQPIFVVGLPRTGTTLLQNLLACDPERRALPFWQLLRPVPDPHRSFDRAWRFGNGVFASALYRWVAPEYRTLHLTTARSLEECWYLFMPSYTVLNADFPMPTSEYGDWILSQDMTPAYRRYRTLLGILAHEVGTSHLVLKCPDHLWFLDCLLRVFPDAGVLWTHRDPAVALPSYAAQMALPARQYMGSVDPKAIGARLQHRFAQGLERATNACDARSQGRVVHVSYAELASAPLATATRALAALGHSVSPSHADAMARYIARGVEKPRQPHIYHAETYGLSAPQLHEHFAAYLERYAAPRGI